jgi:TolB-like protein/Tfp pilus assembly protein PilF
MGWWALREGPTEVSGPILSSIAVLPLENLSGDPEQDYFVDGMTDALITDLSKIGALQVIARHSAMRYKGTEKPLSEIAQELNVEGVVQGSVQRESDEVQITAQLIEATTGSSLWSESYERKLTSVLALHGEVAQAISRQIQVTLTPGEETLLTRTRQVNPEAYEYCLKGKFHAAKLTRADLETALQYYELALEKDPDSALAYAGIAGVWACNQQMSWAPPREAGPKAKAAALKAVELDEELAEAHSSLSGVLCWTDWDWEGAEAAFQRAIELNPNLAPARAGYSHFLMIMRRPDEAMKEITRALELDPYNVIFQSFYAVVLRHRGQYDKALEVYRQILQTNPHNPMALYGMAGIFHRKGMDREAYEMERAGAPTRSPNALRNLELDFEAGGYEELWGRMADRRAERARTKWKSPSRIASLYHRAGRKQETLDWLERAFEERNPNMPYIGLKYADDLLDEPRFQALMRKMNFPEDVLAGYLNDSP